MPLRHTYLNEAAASSPTSPAHQASSMIRFSSTDVRSLTTALEGFSTSPASRSTSTLNSSTITRTPSISAGAPATNDYDLGANAVSEAPWHELTQTNDRGLSLTAARRIPAGTLIFAESPIIKLSLTDESDSSAIDNSFQQLAKPERKQYLKLFNAKSRQSSEVVGIYNSNCYDIKAFDDGGGSCIGLLSSRINHSCVPNTVFSYIPPERVPLHLYAAMAPDQEQRVLERGLMQFRAIKTISKGRELVSNYEKSIFAPRRTRIERLRRYYGFDCTCEACMPVSEFWEKSDARRKQMEEYVKVGAQLEKSWTVLTEGAKDDTGPSDATHELKDICTKAITVLLDLDSLLRKEGLAYTPLANCYRSLAKWSSRSQEAAQAWVKKELDVVIRCFGNDSLRAQALKTELGI